MIIKISPKLLQKQILAPSMQQSIEILMLPIIELDRAIEQELETNPMLEIAEESPARDENRELERIIDKNIERYKSPLNTPSTYTNFTEDEEEEKDNMIAAPGQSLEDFLLQQFRLETSNPLHLKIAELIINELDEYGFFRKSYQNIADALDIQDINEVKKVAEMIKDLDPVGIGAQDLKECLLIQAEYKFNGKSKVIRKMIDNHFEELGKKQFKTIAAKMRIPIETVKELAAEVGKLDPRPAMKFKAPQENTFIKPDVLIIKNEEGRYEARINKDHIPQLRVSSYYQKMLKDKNLKEDEVAFIREKIKNALLFMKSIQQRHETIQRISDYILDYQKDFFEIGNQHIKPMTLKDVAQEISRNESTVCRAINGKYLFFPEQGLVPFKFFFSQAINNENNEEDAVSSRCIKEELKNLIEEEDKESPLSDKKIQSFFERKNMHVARRTISKYRKSLNILPSYLRKN